MHTLADMLSCSPNAVQYMQLKNATLMPSTTLWIFISRFKTFMKAVDECRIAIQGQDIILPEQIAWFSKLLTDIKSMGQLRVQSATWTC